MQKNESFIARGGLWVLAQVPLMLAALVIPVWSGSGHLVPRDIAQGPGVAITVLGIALTIWGLASLGDALSPFPQPLADATLQRNGAYRFMRHPIYSGVALASLGWALWWLSVGGIFCALLLAFFFDCKAAHEEIWLRQQYKEYPDYEAKVKKFIPGVY